ncbi:PqiC family protein [Amaricoccus macauensis]|uniref:PqiC family protein n=1 Tax=Amaricoccus macauensis TaxID=57001 RepID=UPI003C7C6FFB
MRRQYRLGVGAAALALLLSACSGPDYYLMPAQSQPAIRGAAPTRSVVVTDISLPAYAEALEIATLEDNGAVKLQGNASWGDEPRRGFTRHLAAALALRLGSQVGTDPWPAFADEPDYRVEVTTDRLIGREGGTVDFEGQYFILRVASGSIAYSGRFDIEVPVSGPDTVDFVEAHGRAVEILADQIATRIAGRAST